MDESVCAVSPRLSNGRTRTTRSPSVLSDLYVVREFSANSVACQRVNTFLHHASQSILSLSRKWNCKHFLPANHWVSAEIANFRTALKRAPIEVAAKPQRHLLSTVVTQANIGGVRNMVTMMLVSPLRRVENFQRKRRRIPLYRVSSTDSNVDRPVA